MSRFKRGCLRLLLLGIALAAFPFLWRALVKGVYSAHVYTPATLSAPDEGRTAVVFGAAVYPGGRLSPVLRDRVETAVALYHRGQVDTLLMSGDNRADHYDEPGAMAAYARRRGVPATAIVADGAGLRTYDSCYRARRVFGVETAVLVTQAFHLPRAIFTCRQLGITAVGVAADLRPYRGADWYETRETAATLVALWDVLWRRPATIMPPPGGDGYKIP
jgi:SanA protein